MHSDLERIARDRLVLVIDDDIAPSGLDLDLDMAQDYGLSSLKKVVFLTSVCDDAEISLSRFTERDVAEMRTLRDVTTALARHAGQETTA